MNSKWLHLVPRRERELWAALRPFLNDVKQTLDFECGCSPLAPYFLASGISLIGVDINAGMIGKLRKLFPQAEWIIAHGEEFRLPLAFQPNLLVWMGIDSASGTGNFRRLAEDGKPEVILLEFAEAYSVGQTVAATLAQFLRMTEYKLVREGEITMTAEFKYRRRLFRIYMKNANGVA